MANKTLNVRIQNKYDTEANWASKNPVLLKGEAAYSSDKNGLYKIGNGTSKWSDLKYGLSSELDALTNNKSDFKFSHHVIENTGTAYYTKLFELTADSTYINYNYEFAIAERNGGIAYVHIYLYSDNNKYFTDALIRYKTDSGYADFITGNMKGFVYKDTTKQYSKLEVWFKVNAWQDVRIMEKTVSDRGCKFTWASNFTRNAAFPTDATSIVEPKPQTVAWGNITGKPSTYYTHPSYTARSSGLYKVTVDATGHVSGATAVSKADITALGIPGTDTNTWRGVQNNLTSTATDQSLSAAQGKILNELTFQKKKAIDATVDWDTLKEFGCYKIQMASWGDAATKHSPNAYGNVYQFGLLLVFRGYDADTENRTVQIYIPHKADANVSSVVLMRMLNGTGWQAWHPIARGTGWSDIINKPTTFTPSSHTHDDRYYTESEINSKLATYLPLAGGTMTGNLAFSNNKAGISWARASDGASILFNAETDATDNYLEFHVTDDEAVNFKWTKTVGSENLTLGTWKREGIRLGVGSFIGSLTGNVYGNVYLNTTQSVIQNQMDTSNYTSPITWKKGGKGWYYKDSNNEDKKYTYDPQIGQHNTGNDGNGSIVILPYATNTSPWGGQVGLYIGKNNLKLDGNNVLHTGNYNNYSPTKTGGGASGTWGISVSGNSATTTKLITVRSINGTNFDGTGNITTATWGTARNITIGSTKKSVNGSADVSWSLSEIGAAAASHSHSYLPLNGGTLTGALNISRGSVDKVSPTSQDIVINVPSTDETKKSPGIGFHVAGKNYATLKYLSDGSFRFYNSTLASYVPVYASFYGNLSGNATTATNVAWSGVTGKPSTFTPSSHTHNQYYDSGISRAANTVLAAPNGANGTATFRKLVAADIPTLTKSKISDFPTSLAPTAGSNNYVRVYNSKDIGNSSTVTFNDLAKQHFAMGMINGATDNPYGAAKWAHGISMAWSNGANTSWISQIALGVQEGTGMWYRTKPGTIVGADWTRVLDSSNYTSYAATKGHTHSSIKDIGNGTDTTFAYSKAGMNYADYTWLAAWNGNELRAVAKSQFAQASHSHSNIISSGKKTSTASGTAANDPTKEIPLSGISMYETYSDSNTPCNYGNIINAIGSTYKGAGQLLLGWSGADSTTERMYYRSHRDMATGGWGAWKTIAWTSDIPTTLKNPSSLSIQLNGGTATVYDGSAAKSINITASSVGASIAGHTHTSTTLYSAGSRPTNINFATNTNGAGAMFHFVATSSTTTGKPPVDCNILQMNWDNNGGYDTQLALANTGDSAYLRGQHQGTWSVWKEFSFIGHTHNYAGSSSAGGAATSANKLNTNAGSATQPVYFSGGVPVACTHTLGKSVPADAKFTDTNTWRPLGTTGDTACAGNDSRLSNARPASDVYAWAKASSKPSYSWGEITGKPGAFNPSSHNHRDLDAIGSVGYYGSDVANSNGWYKVYSTTLTGYNDHVARLSIVSGYNPYASGLLILHLRCNNTTSLNVQQLIWETRQGFNADDVIINTNGNTWTLYLKITNTQYGRVKIRVLESTSTVNNWSISLSNNTTKESTNPKATATAKDGAIVNYANSAGSVAWSGISGKPSLVGKTIKSLTAASSSGWSDLTSAQNLIPDMSVIAYWNGAYSNTSSNLAYCNKGAFGTIVTKNAGDYATAGHTHHYAGSSSAGGSATSAVKLDTSTAGSATQPVYFTGGKPVACTYTLGKSVPSNAVFTDTNNKMTQTAIASKDYTNWRTILWGASNSGTEGFTPTTVTDGAFTDTNLSYQPSTGTLRAKVFKGALSANTTIGSTSGLETTLEFTAGEPKGTGAITQTYYLMNDFKTDYVFGVKNKSKAWISYYFGDQVYFKNSSADISALAGKMLPPVLTDFSGNKNNPGAGTGRVLSIASNVDAKIIKFRIFTSSSATTATTVNVTYSTSDIRLKDNVKDTDIKDALSVINKMKIRQFDWKDDNKHQKIGFVADELEELDDKLVVGGGWEDEEHTQMNVKGVDTFYMMGYVVKGMQELSEQIKALTEENKELKKQIEGLKREG